MQLPFATKNDDKLREAQAILAPHEVVPLDVRKIELRNDDLAQIASYAARRIKEGYQGPFFVEDSGIFIESLNGFPGPYSSGIYRLLGHRRLLTLMEDVLDRSATFRSVVAFDSPTTDLRVFAGEVKGKIATTPRGTGGFDYDSLFIPDQGEGQTFAEMGFDLKNRLSHRARALNGLRDFLSTLSD